MYKVKVKRYGEFIASVKMKTVPGIGDSLKVDEIYYKVKERCFVIEPLDEWVDSLRVILIVE